MHSESLRPLFVLGAFATVPFLFGANGKGCQPPPVSADAGMPPPEDGGQGPGDDASAPDASAPDASAIADAGACVSLAGGPCGGFTQAPCSCAPGLVCETNRIPDVPGVCTEPADAACVDNVLCILGDHWDPAQCKCVPDADAEAEVDAGATPDARVCLDNVSCIGGDHWDPAQCKCVPMAPEGGACTVATDCHGALPQLCVQTCDGGPGACAHFACKNGVCETVLCE